jgi:CheY-like chemotaxis protein
VYSSTKPGAFTYRPQIPVLYISGYAGEDRSLELLKNGAAFLAKPFTAASLAQKVREVLTGQPG